MNTRTTKADAGVMCGSHHNLQTQIFSF